MEEIRVGVIGATGMAGREAVLHQETLNKNGKPYAELTLVTGSSNSAGRKLGEVFGEKEETLENRYGFWKSQECPEKYKEMEVRRTDPDIIADEADYVISALPSDVAAEIEPQLRERGVNVFSNASEFRWAENVPLVIPSVNPDQIEMVEKQDEEGVQVNNPNCTTSGFVPVLRALKGVSEVNITTFQSISGKGDKISGNEYSERIKGNVVDDWNPETARNGEEVKSETEPQKILGNHFKKSDAENAENPFITAQTTRVPTQYGHLEKMFIEFEDYVEAETVKKRLKEFQVSEEVQKLPSTAQKPVKVMENQVEPRKDVFEEEGMAICVSDIRQISEKKISLFTLSHNLRLGATWTARNSMELYLNRYEGMFDG